ncbi:MAG: hypothetical protein R3C03_23415 [Pirellulaceae bacterium]
MKTLSESVKGKLILVSREDSLQKLHRNGADDGLYKNISPFAVISGQDSERHTDDQQTVVEAESQELLDLHAKFYHLDLDDDNRALRDLDRLTQCDRKCLEQQEC